jgi:XTP/dITP diphosphohydrolase
LRASMNLVIASHNEGKVREFRDLLAPLGYCVVSAEELDLPEPEETGDTFEANAELKAIAAARASGMRALADDSGLAVPALNDAPGIYSARWAGPQKDFSAAMSRIARELHNAGIEPNGAAAYFVCALSLALPDGTMHTLRGEVHGTLTFPSRGAHGFGYDPIFIPSGYSDTFAEMELAFKHRISHRAKAFEALLRHLRQENAA